MDDTRGVLADVRGGWSSDEPTSLAREKHVKNREWDMGKIGQERIGRIPNNRY